jgi:uncharacterized protein (DUF58 family)
MNVSPHKKNRPIWTTWLRRADEAASRLPDLIIRSDKAVRMVLSGSHSQKRAGTGEDFWQYREYIEGDRPQDIDWRRSARGDRTFVRQKEWQTTQPILFWCQRNQAMTFSSSKALPSKGDDAIVIMLALTQLLNQAGELTGVLSGTLKPNRSTRLRSELAQYVYETVTSELPHPNYDHIPLNSHAILIGDFLSPPTMLNDMARALSSRVSKTTIIQVLDPAEIELPYSGRIIFENDAAGSKQIIENVEAVRQAYAHRMEAHINFVRNLCKKHQWDYVLHRTDQDVSLALLALSQLNASVASGGR